MILKAKVLVNSSVYRSRNKRNGRQQTLLLGRVQNRLKISRKMAGITKRVLKRVDRPTRLPCTWSDVCCLCHNFALDFEYIFEWTPLLGGSCSIHLAMVFAL